VNITRYEQGRLMSQAVVHGDTIYLPGVAPKNADADIKQQTKECFAQIDRLLALCGSNKTKILSAQVWVTDIRHREAMNEEWLAWIDKGNLPARACVEAKLHDPKVLVELMIIAAK
jgi:enamine deaminase RidA (YjgF/YER057c/UK114 family)